MGSGTLIQLVGYGSQDIYLTGNPQITFFKHVYKRHTNFAQETIDEVFVNDIRINNGNNSTIYTQNKHKLTCILSNPGDLLVQTYLELELIKPLQNVDGVIQVGELVKRPGHAIIDSIEIEIGGQIIEKQYGEWIDIWAQLSNTNNSFLKLERMINCSLVKNTEKDDTNRIHKMFIPLPFFFTKHPGLALPLTSLYYNDVKIHVTLNVDTSIMKFPLDQLHTRPRINKAHLICDYIFLDIEEHRAFRKLSREYLIEQVQFSGNKVFPKIAQIANIRLKFNHPCKELVWICQDSSHILPATDKYMPFCYNKGNSGGDLINSVNLLFNNNLRFREREATLFRTLQSYQHHIGGFDNNVINEMEKGFIYSYSFSLNPEEYNPSGTCNFSRIDDPILSLKLNNSIGDTKSIRVYALSYNIFKVSNGMGALVYVN